MNAFDRFGQAHWMVVAVTAAAALVAIRTARHSRAGAVVRIALSILLAATMLAFLIGEGVRGTLTPTDFLPLHLCDFAVLLAIVSLLTLRRRAAELLYFLSLAEVLAIITPDVGHGFPHPHTMVFFILHGGTLVAALLLTFGYRLMPEKGGVVRALVFLNVYAAFTAVVNLMLGTNFLYLRYKPSQPSPLDWMGRWPWYLIASEAVAAALFLIADVPFRRHRSRAEVDVERGDRR